jgi:hypothetical protein
LGIRLGRNELRIRRKCHGHWAEVNTGNTTSEVITARR